MRIISGILLISGLLCSLLTGSEGASIDGKVIDSQTGLPLSGANVMIAGTKTGRGTNDNGLFSFGNMEPGEYKIVFSYIGYETAEKIVSVWGNETVTLEISLTPQFLKTPVIEIVGERIEQIQRIPGSALVINESRLESVNPLNANEIFRSVSGVTVREEEGQGLRPNLGLRGLDPTRTRKVLMLEDGVPIALAPYGEPELYYNPPIDRMKRVEILKGSGSILFGPQTVGGVINYITRQPPLNPTFSARITAGSNGFLSGLFSYGGTWRDVGMDITYLRKQGDGFRDYSDFSIHDLTSQMALGISRSSRLGIKLNVYDEYSRSTYLGLTLPMFVQNPCQNPAINDQMHVRRFSVSATHQHIISNDILLSTTIYANNTIRNWRRQDYDREDKGIEYERIVGDPSIPGGAIYFKNSTGNRNREFTVYGLEPRFQINHEFLSLQGELDFGGRIHFEDMQFLRIDGSTPTALSGTIREDELRNTKSLSGFAQNRFFLNDRLIVTPGIRIEHYLFTINIRRDIVDGTPVDVDREAASRSTEIIPGFGVSYSPVEKITLFTGLHRGFAPPRVQDAIDNEGTNLELDAEHSWNYELGIRAEPLHWLYGDLTFYFLDFQNQIIPASEAGGIDTRLINAGETVHRGIESTVGMDAGLLMGAPFNFIVETSATFSDARFASGIYKDNRLPHAPESLYNLRVQFTHQSGWDITLNGYHTSEQFTDRANIRESSMDGEIGMIESYTIWNISANYELPWINGIIYGTVKNMFNTVYIASRAPRGIFPGPFRQINLGLQWTI